MSYINKALVFTAVLLMILHETVYALALSDAIYFFYSTVFKLLGFSAAEGQKLLSHRLAKPVLMLILFSLLYVVMGLAKLRCIIHFTKGDQRAYQLFAFLLLNAAYIIALLFLGFAFNYGLSLSAFSFPALYLLPAVIAWAVWKVQNAKQKQAGLA